MKCVILAGGVGSRLFEETIAKPKALVKIGPYPIILHLILNLSKYNTNTFLICCGHKGDQIINFFKRYKISNDTYLLPKNIKKKIFFLKTGINSGTEGRLYKTKKFIKKDEDFLICYTDALSNINFKQMMSQHKKNNKILTMTVTRPKERYGIAVIKSNNLISFNEKKNEQKNYKYWINAGFFVAKHKIFKYFKNKKNYFEKEPLDKLIKINQVKVYKHLGEWKSVDTYKDLLTLKKAWRINSFWKNW